MRVAWLKMEKLKVAQIDNDVNLLVMKTDFGWPAALLYLKN